eukprot:m.846944 g.846944  ORF g.846944 m.846944 type:complete len:118 (+) comp59562_c0_seq23:599-952(+)
MSDWTSCWRGISCTECAAHSWAACLLGQTGPLATLTTESGVRVARELNAEYWEASSKLDDGVTAFFCRVAAVTFDAMMLKQMAAETEGGVTPIGSPAPRRKNIRLDEPPAESSGCKC